MEYRIGRGKGKGTRMVAGPLPRLVGGGGVGEKDEKGVRR